MEDSQIKKLLTSFPDLEYIETKRVYNAGRSGAPVFAAEFRKISSSAIVIYVVKIEEKEQVENEQSFSDTLSDNLLTKDGGQIANEQDFVNIPSSKLLASLLAPIHAYSELHEGYGAIAYEVAFDELLVDISLFDILRQENRIEKTQVVQHITLASQALAAYHRQAKGNDERFSPAELLKRMLDWRVRTIRGRLQTTLPDWPPTALRLHFDNDYTIRNPLPYLQADAWTWTTYRVTTPVGYIHGDLHSGNILFNPRDSQPPLALIDFGQTRPNGVPLLDFAYLEFDIMQNVLHAATTSTDWFTLLEYCMSAIIPSKALPTGTSWKVVQAWEFIQPIRKAVESLSPDPAQQMQYTDYELTWWFATVAAGLNFAQKGKAEQQRPPQERKAALLYAAYGLRRIDGIFDWKMPGQDGTLPSVFWEDTTDNERLYRETLCDREDRQITLSRQAIDNLGLGNVPIPALTEIFIWPEVFQGIQLHDTFIQGQGAIAQRQRSTRQQRDTLSGKPPQRQNLADVLIEHPHLVILGHVGTGKTTLLRYLLLQMAHKDPDFTGRFVKLAALLPIFIDAPSYADALEGDTIPRLEDFLPGYLSTKYPNTDYAPFLLEMAKRGKVLFLFDGLDRIINKGIRTQVVKRISFFFSNASLYGKSRCIVTSRITGYKDTRLSADFQVYTLANFDTQIEDCIQRWHKAYQSSRREIHPVALLQGIIQLDRDVHLLACNPLLLTILIMSQLLASSDPFRRVTYFKNCVKFLVTIWPHTKGYSLPLPEDSLQRVLESLAFWIYQYQNKQVLSVKDISREIKEQIKQQKKPRPSASQIEKLSEEFIEFVSNQVGILIEQTEAYATFLCSPILEYLAAGGLLVRSDKYDFIREHLHDLHWCKVIRLVVGITLSEPSEPGIDALIGVIVPNNAPNGVLSPRDLFVGLCMIDNAGFERAMKTMEKIASYYLDGDSNWLRTASSQILRLWGNTRAADDMKEVLLSLFKDPEAVLRKNEPYLWFQPVSWNGIIIEKYRGLTEPNGEMRRTRLRLRIIALLYLLSANKTPWIKDAKAEAIAAVSHSSWEVRETAATTLGVLGEKCVDVLPHLLKMLSDAEWRVSSAAATALGMLANIHEHILAELCTIFTGTDQGTLPRSKEAAIMALGYIRHEGLPSVIPKLKKAIKNTSASSNAVISDIKQNNSIKPETVPIIIDALAESVAAIERTSIVSLGQMARKQSEHAYTHVEDVWRLLHSAIGNGNPSIRQAATIALGDLSHECWRAQRPDIIQALYVALSDSYQPVREAASMALASLDNPLMPVDDFLPGVQ
jgi:HEAT repeat protein